MFIKRCKVEVKVMDDKKVKEILVEQAKASSKHEEEFSKTTEEASSKKKVN